MMSLSYRSGAPELFTMILCPSSSCHVCVVSDITPNSLCMAESGEFALVVFPENCFAICGTARQWRAASSIVICHLDCLLETYNLA